MPESLVISKGAEEATRELLRSLLESGQVGAVLALGRTGSGGEGVPRVPFSRSCPPTPAGCSPA